MHKSKRIVLLSPTKLPTDREDSFNVGISGSGKSTLMKLALGFMQPISGSILLGKYPISDYKVSEWRKQCSMVTQEGFIFTDTVLNNVTGGENKMDYAAYLDAIQCAGLNDFIESLPIKHKTIIGKSGLSLSSGQRQRILIARVFYKKPKFVFLDEATNSLDSETEAKIVENIDMFLKNKTKLIIAHRLNTVKNADKIIVLNNGKIVEEGTHRDLIWHKSYYHTLVNQQLELT